jgi:hypothetical protein
MPLGDLSKVTSAVMLTLKNRVQELTGIATVNPTAAPPDEVSEVSNDNVLSLFLYHTMEDPHFKNAAPPSKGTNVPEVAQAPMGLDLYYVLTAHHTTALDPSENVLREQLLFGAALKTLHDIPVITQHTVVGGTVIFDAVDIEPGNVIQIVYRPLTPEDSINFWSSEQDKVTRLSAYYEVRVAFLRPEPPRLAAAGIVLNLGAYVFTDGTPQITRSASHIGFVLPTVAGTLSDPVELSPARVALLLQDDTPTVPPLPAIALGNNVLELHGAGLSRDKTTLLLTSTRWVTATNPSGTLAIVPADNATWYAGGTIADRLVRVRVRPEITVGVDTFDVFPGNYSATLRVSRTIDPPGPALARDLDTLSNTVGFTVTPQILEVPLVPTKDGSLTIVGDYLLATGIVVELFIAGVAFVSTGGVPADGQFRIVSPGGSVVEFRLNDALDGQLGPNTPLPLRLVVNGADAPPAWVERVP